jgi:FkbM family methyltransferase
MASHSDARLVCAARNAIYWLLDFVHAENHNIQTNGEARLLECLGSSATTIFDVGANRGIWALVAHNHCVNANIYSFEIATETRIYLRENTANVEGIIVIDFGLSDHAGFERVKYYPERDTVTSIYDYPHPEQYIWKKERVEQGDTFVKEKGLTQIDLLKIDTEGADFRVLRGFDATLSRGMISVVQFEYGYAGILSRALLIDFYEYLEPKGYILGKLRSNYVDFRPYQLKDENFFGPNFVAVHRNHHSLISRLANNQR